MTAGSSDKHPWAVGMRVRLTRRSWGGTAQNVHDAVISRLTLSRAFLNGRDRFYIERRTGIIRPKYLTDETTAEPLEAPRG